MSPRPEKRAEEQLDLFAKPANKSTVFLAGIAVGATLVCLAFLAGFLYGSLR